MKTCIDCYGNRLDLSPYRYLTQFGQKSPYLVDAVTEGVTYICFYDTTDNQPIQRITEQDGVTEILWAYGKWSNRTTLSYEMPLSKPLIIEV